MLTNSSKTGAWAVKMILVLAGALGWLAGDYGVAAARSGVPGCGQGAVTRHVLPLKAHPGAPVFLGSFIKRDYGAKVFRSRFQRPLARNGRAVLMVHVDVAEKWPVIINTIQIGHKGERLAYHLGRRMVQGWNSIPLGHIPWQHGRIRVSFDHGRGSRVGIYLAGKGHRSFPYARHALHQ